MKRILCLCLALLITISLCACGSTEVDDETVTKIKFSQSIDEIKSLKGKTVEINGFMSMLSPLNGELIYLMNVPLQSCPFCVPNTTTLSNTIAVQGKNIEYTSKPVKITGKLATGNFVDEYGYQYDFRIEDATITVLDEAELSEKMKIYYSLTENDYLTELYNVCLYIDETAYYADYGISAEEILKFGEIPFDRYEEIHSLVTSLNTNGDYDEFLQLLEKVNTTRIEINKEIKEKNVEGFARFQETSNTIYGELTDFINKYEF